MSTVLAWVIMEIVGTGVMFGLIQFCFYRHNSAHLQGEKNGFDRPLETPHISAAVRAEIDETPEWWDGRFHTLLSETKTPLFQHPHGHKILKRSFANTMVVAYSSHPDWFSDCTCKSCLDGQGAWKHERYLYHEPTGR